MESRRAELSPRQFCLEMTASISNANIRHAIVVVCLLLNMQNQQFSARAAVTSNRHTDKALANLTMAISQAIPATRIRGQVGCYSCVAWTDWNDGTTHLDVKLSGPSSGHSSPGKNNLAKMFRHSGMQMPKWVSRCADADSNPTGRPNFAGADLKICRNSAEQPGACVKLKGLYKGRKFVYRDCWERMWLEPRAYSHEYSGKCYADEPVQTFLSSEQNTLCFCEEDLCNGASGVQRSGREMTGRRRRSMGGMEEAADWGKLLGIFTAFRLQMRLNGFMDNYYL